MHKTAIIMKFHSRLILLTVLSLAVTFSAEARKPQNLRLLYWNIQNGMWSDQGNNYDNFVEFVKSQKPDICVWAEGQSIYRTGTADRFEDSMDRYLVSNWDELAARYGHTYVYIGGHRDDFPQVITSRYPVHNVERILGVRPDSVVCHGAGWATVEVGKCKLNIVTVHTWPQRYNYGIPVEDRARSGAAKEGDFYRAKEMKYICEHTILSEKADTSECWMMMGDFNAISSLDNGHYGYPADTSAFLVHDYILGNTPYRDAVWEEHGTDFQSTIISGRRLDFVYMTPALLKMMESADVLREGWVRNYRDPQHLSNFSHPSDHLPIVVDWKIY